MQVKYWCKTMKNKAEPTIISFCRFFQEIRENFENISLCFFFLRCKPFPSEPSATNLIIVSENWYIKHYVGFPLIIFRVIQKNRSQSPLKSVTWYIQLLGKEETEESRLNAPKTYYASKQPPIKRTTGAKIIKLGCALLKIVIRR